MAQWYGKLPAVGKVMGNLPPGAIDPEFHVPPFAVEVWATTSLLIQVTVPPTATVMGLGEYAVDVRVAEPATIEALTLDPDGAGVGVGVDGEDEPQATDAASSSVA
jgi:hypothetical protein